MTKTRKITRTKEDKSWYIDSFHVTSYQANFASNNTRDGQVCFLFARARVGNINKMSRYFLLSSHHNTKLQQCQEYQHTPQIYMDTRNRVMASSAVRSEFEVFVLFPMLRANHRPIHSQNYIFCISKTICFVQGIYFCLCKNIYLCKTYSFAYAKIYVLHNL